MSGRIRVLPRYDAQGVLLQDGYYRGTGYGREVKNDPAYQTFLNEKEKWRLKARGNRLLPGMGIMKEHGFKPQERVVGQGNGNFFLGRMGANGQPANPGNISFFGAPAGPGINGNRPSGMPGINSNWRRGDGQVGRVRQDLNVSHFPQHWDPRGNPALIYDPPLRQGVVDPRAPLGQPGQFRAPFQQPQLGFFNPNDPRSQGFGPR